MNTVSVTVTVSESDRAFLFAFLSEIPVEGIEELDDHVTLFFLEKNWIPAIEDRITGYLSASGLNPILRIEIIEPQNWNRQWEEELQPLVVGPFFISPDGSVPNPSDDKVLLRIRPQMSFGTGYHESTRLALRHLADIPLEGLRVLDAGTGTGILAIAAARTGADHVVAYDFDVWSYRNGGDNMAANGVADSITLIMGTIDDVPSGQFDVILANINRNVLLDIIPKLSDRLASDGKLILSGLLNGDQRTIRAALHCSHLRVHSELTEGDWWSPCIIPVSTVCPIDRHG